MKRTVMTITAALLVGLIAIVSAGAKSSAGRITGAGSTFVAPLVSLWAADYASKTGTQVAYSPVGSGAGIAAITARQVDFGASDAPLSTDQFTACNGCVQIPWALGATSIIYNLNGVPNNLHMTADSARQHLPGQHQDLGRPGDQGAQPEGQPAVDLDHAGLSQ
jgi:phosphate transport system substrate-binding protein